MSNFVTITPAVDKRILVNSSFNIVYSAALKKETVIKNTIIFEDSAGLDVDFTVSLSGSGTTITITPAKSLDYNTVYEITLTTKIYGVDNNAIIQKQIKFVTEKMSTVPNVTVSQDGNRNASTHRNILLPELFDPKKMIEEGNKFNFQYVPTTFDSTTKRYSYNGYEKILFDNKNIFESLNTHELLATFSAYFDAINASNTLTESQFEDIKKVLLDRSFDINTSNGFIGKIIYLIEIFADVLNYHFVAVEPDIKNPFKYIIASDLPKENWTKVIKNIVHPVGWIDTYYQVVQGFLEHYQTENYNWSDDYLLNSLREKLSVHGQDRANIISGTNTNHDFLDMNRNFISNPVTYQPKFFANPTAPYLYKGTGAVVKNNKTIQIDINLTTIDIDSMNGYELILPNGNNRGVYTIIKNTNLATNNIITVAELFSTIEAYSNDYQINNGEGTTQADLLSVITNLRKINKPLITYLQTYSLSSALSDASRLTFNEDSVLQMIVVKNSPLKEFSSGDITFKYTTDAYPVLYISSTYYNTVSDLTFGNVVLNNNIVEKVSNDVNYTVANFNTPVIVDNTGIQTITLTTNPVGFISVGDMVVASGASAVNNGAYPVLTVGTNFIKVNNPDGSSQVVAATLTHKKTHYVYTKIKPSTFSFDLKMFVGYSMYFNKFVIDISDGNFIDKFNYKYSKYNGTITFPSNPSTISSALNHTKNFQKINTNIYMKKYTLAENPKIKWKQFDNIYEFTNVWGSTKSYSVNDEIVALSDTGNINVYKILPHIPLNYYYFYDSSAATFSNFYDACNSATVDDVYLFSGTAVDVTDSFYIGSDYTFNNLNINVTTVGVGAYTIVWEYWHNTNNVWTTFAVTDGTNNFKNSGLNTVTWADLSSTWGKTIVNGVYSYWIRFRTDAGSRTTVPIASTINRNITQGATSGSTKPVWKDYGTSKDSNIFWTHMKKITQFEGNIYSGGRIGKIEKLVSLKRTYLETKTSLVDESNNIKSTDTGLLNFLDATPEIGDAYYFGATDYFHRLNLNITTAGVGTWTVVWEYWSGDSWQALADVTDGSNKFTIAGSVAVTWTNPTLEWRPILKDGSQLYYVRARISAFTSLTTLPVANYAWINDMVSSFYESGLKSLIYYDSSIKNYTDQLAIVDKTISINVNDVYYFGNDTKFNEIDFSLTINGVGGTYVWEYWNGKTWDSLTVTDGTSGFTQNGRVKFIDTADWATTNIKDKTSVVFGPYYFVRVRTTLASSTNPVSDIIKIFRHFSDKKYYGNAYTMNNDYDTNLDKSSNFQNMDASNFNRRIKLGFDYPNPETYARWLAYIASGTDTTVERVSLENKIVLLAKTGTVYNANVYNYYQTPEISRVTTVADVTGSLGGKYFKVYSGDNTREYYVWFNVNAGSSEPITSGIGLEISITQNETAINIARKIEEKLSTINFGLDFEVSRNESVLTITTESGYGAAPTTTATEGTSGFAFLSIADSNIFVQLMKPVAQTYSFESL